MQFLKKSVDALHNKLTREQAEHARNRVAVMEINQNLIHDINGESGLKAKIEKLQQIFGDEGGSKKLNEILKKTAERERMMDQIEQSELGGTMPSSRSLVPSAQGDEQLDPAVQREIQHKQQYIEKLR